MNTSRSDASQFLENTEDTGLQEHMDENCLYCACIQILAYQPTNKVNSSYSHTDFSDIPYTDWYGQTIHDHLDVHSSKFSGISSCSDAVSHDSASSTKSTELVLGVKSIPDDTPVCRILLRKEVLHLMHEEAEAILATPTKQPVIAISAES